MWGSVLFTVDFHRSVVNEFGITFEQGYLIVAQHPVVRGMNARYVRLTVLNQRRPVKFIYRYIKAVIRTVLMNGFCYLGAVPHSFFRHTAHIYTGTAHRFCFNKQDFLAVFCCPVGRGNTATAAANTDIVKLLHRKFSRHCSAAIVHDFV